MRAMQVDFHTTPLRANKFLELYRPAISRVLAYGAKGYLLKGARVEEIFVVTEGGGVELREAFAGSGLPARPDLDPSRSVDA